MTTPSDREPTAEDRAYVEACAIMHKPGDGGAKWLTQEIATAIRRAEARGRTPAPTPAPAKCPTCGGTRDNPLDVDRFELCDDRWHEAAPTPAPDELPPELLAVLRDDRLDAPELPGELALLREAVPNLLARARRAEAKVALANIDASKFAYPDNVPSVSATVNAKPAETAPVSEPPETTEQMVERTFKEARKRVQPMVDKIRESERVTGDLMNMVLRSPTSDGCATTVSVPTRCGQPVVDGQSCARHLPLGHPKRVAPPAPTPPPKGTP